MLAWLSHPLIPEVSSTYAGSGLPWAGSVLWSAKPSLITRSSDFAADADHLAGFEREAKLLMLK